MRKLLFVSLLFSSAALAGPPSKPQCISDECSIGKITTLQALSSRGNVEASFALGHVFMNNNSGVKTDYAMSYYFDRAARYKFWPAIRQTAGMLARGIGVEQNLPAARKRMLKAARRGVDKAAEEYAVLVFSDPTANEEDRARATNYLRQEVDKGMSYLANYTLAYLHLTGDYVEQDVDKAMELLVFPASGHFANAQTILRQLESKDLDKRELIENATETAKTWNIDPNVEVITVKGLRQDLASVTDAVMDQLRLSHGQTGSRIKGNGCTENLPGCEVLDARKPANAVASIGLK